MTRRLPPRARAVARVALLGGVLVLALTAPIPSLPDDGRAAVQSEVRERLPGWDITRLDPSWEGAYTVVTRCVGREMGFQYVPGHGLPPNDAWLQPNDEYARERLRDVSDHWRYLVWYDDPAIVDSFSCAEEIARGDDPPMRARIFD